MSRTTRILRAGWVVMVVVGASRPVLAQSRPVASQVQDPGHVDDDGVAVGEPVATAANSIRGSIGAAKRYHAPQITDKDVEFGDVSAQQMGDSELLSALKNQDLAAALRPYGPICHGTCIKQFLAALQNPSLAKALQRPELAAALRPYGPICHGSCTKQFLATPQNPSFAKALQNPQVFAAQQNPASPDARADRR
jgi:hypothetical protein